MDAFFDLNHFQVIALDTETTGVDWLRDKMFSFAISTPDGRDHYWDIRHTPQALRWLIDQMAAYRGLVVNHHMKFDLHMLRNEGVVIDPRQCECTMIRAALIDEHRMSYALDDVAKDCIGKKKDDRIYHELAAIFGGEPKRAVQISRLSKAPPEIVGRYAKRDTRVALELWEWQNGEIEAQELQQVWALEKRLFPHIFKQERHGIRVDEAAAEQQMQRMTGEIDRVRAEINSIAGFEVNPNPSGSIKKLFEPVKRDGKWFANDGTPLATTDAGAPSLGAAALERMKHPAAAKILDVRKLLRVRDTFLKGHVLGHAHNGRVHPNINQTKGDETGGTGTGRLSYTNPAMQQIPNRDKRLAAMVRPVFLPDEGHAWSYGDLEQHEFRIFCHYTKAPAILAAYKEDPDLDFHTIVAEMTGLPRSAKRSGQANAKQINLGMVFNMGGGLLAAQMGLPYTSEMVKFRGESEEREILRPGEEALEVMERYYAAVPGVKEMAQQASSIAKSRGYVRTIKGRHIRFPGGKFTHKASGLVYQGSSADLNKENVCRICEFLEDEGAGANFLLNIHDEYSISTPLDGVRARMQECKRLIQDRPELRVPIRVDFSMPGSTWWEATQNEIITT